MARDPDAKLDTPTFFKHDIERIAKESVAPIVADLVDKAIDDGRINIDDNVQRIIQADKDILSQCVVDEENSHLIFPKNVLPLMYYNDDGDYTIYFDYKTSTLRDSNGDIISEFDIDYIKKQVIIFFGDVFSASADGLTYINFNNYSGSLNAYALYNPVTSGGTKLYIHQITFIDINEDTYTFSIISTKSTSYTQADLTNGLSTSIDVININYLEYNRLISIFDLSDGTLNYSDADGNGVAINDITSFEDSVTEL